MKLGVAIATMGRKEQVTRLLEYLEGQTRLPDIVVVSAPDKSHVPDYCSTRFPIRYLLGARGSCAQRNRLLEELLPTSDLITFFDDDFLPAHDYLKIIASSLRDDSEICVAMGNVIADGARGPEITFDKGLELLRARTRSTDTKVITGFVGAYGCNMSIRAGAVGALRFDERLALHGWQEDVDFTSQLRKSGKIAKICSAHGVHLGLKAARVSGVRLGYSQVANPLYLVRKGTVPGRFALNLMARNVAANIVKSFAPEPHVDRRGRLKGNVLAAIHALYGRFEPEYILEL